MSTETFIALAEEIVARLAEYSSDLYSCDSEFWRGFHGLTAELEEERLRSWQWPVESANAMRPAMLCFTVYCSEADSIDWAIPTSWARTLPDGILAADKMILSDPLSDNVWLYILAKTHAPETETERFPDSIIGLHHVTATESERCMIGVQVCSVPTDEAVKKAMLVLRMWIRAATILEQQCRTSADDLGVDSSPDTVAGSQPDCPGQNGLAEVITRLNAKQQDILRVLFENEATAVARMMTSDAVAVKYAKSNSVDGSVVKRDIGELGRRGLVTTVRGPKGGSYLSNVGVQVARALPKESERKENNRNVKGT